MSVDDEAHDLSVIVPCLNEAANLPALVARTDAFRRSFDHSCELVLVDDGSADDTWRVIQDLRRDHAFVRGVRHRRRQGIPRAWQTGLSVASGSLACVLDADLQYDPGEIGLLWQARRHSGADIVQGWRSPRQRSADVRLVLSRGLNHLLNAAFGMSLRDNKSGFFLCDTDVLTDLLRCGHGYVHFQCFVMAAAHARGYRIAEVEASFRPRQAGRSAFGDLPVRATFEVLLDLVHATRALGGEKA